VVGFKPTYGTVPTDGVLPLSWSNDHVGPIAGGVAEAGLLLEVLAGVRRAPGAHPPARAASRPLVGEELALVDPAVTEVVDRFCAELERGGARIDEVELPLRTARAAVATMVLPELAAGPRGPAGRDRLSEGYGERILNAIRRGQQALAVEYVAAVRYRDRFAALVEDLLGRPVTPWCCPPSRWSRPRSRSRVIELGDGRRWASRRR
jgi:aspartyl-tRNA(Asn)/glutamyl-tRNA(Gln) amidotransferase subunit A